MADGGHGSRKIGLRAKKKIVGKMASKSLAKAFVDDATRHLLDNLSRIAKKNGPSEEEAKKLIKKLIKIVGKIGLLYKDNEFSKEEIMLGKRIKKKFRSTAMTFISFYEKESSFDCELLINSLEECKGLLHQLIQRHLTAKSHSRIDYVFNYFCNEDLLKRVFEPRGPYQEIVKNMVDNLKELKIIEKDSVCDVVQSK